MEVKPPAPPLADLPEAMRRGEAASGLEERFGGFLESVPDAMVVTGADGVILQVNTQAERLFGYPRSELVGRGLEILVPPRFRQAHSGHRTGYMADPHVRPIGAALDLYGMRKDGTEFPADISLSPLHTQAGPIVLSAIRDISDRKRLEEELRQKSREIAEQNRLLLEANRLKSEFLAGMSHELRTPLNAIIGFAELMYDGKVGAVSAEHKEFLGDILNSSRHLLQLINGVLDLAKVEAGRIELRPEPVDLPRTIGEIADVLRALAAGRGIEIEVCVAPGLGEVVADVGKLKQVLYNYLSNAVKFSPDGGRVRVRARPEGERELRIEVEDSGIGIKPEDFGRLFVEFQQLGAGGRKPAAGTGLGLALTRRIVEAQGGRVGLESTPGQGSLFYAVLPRIAAEVRRPPGGPSGLEPPVEAGDGR